MANMLFPVLKAAERIGRQNQNEKSFLNIVSFLRIIIRLNPILGFNLFWRFYSFPIS